MSTKRASSTQAPWFRTLACKTHGPQRCMGCTAHSCLQPASPARQSRFTWRSASSFSLQRLAVQNIQSSCCCTKYFKDRNCALLLKKTIHFEIQFVPQKAHSLFLHSRLYLPIHAPGRLCHISMFKRITGKRSFYFLH